MARVSLKSVETHDSKKVTGVSFQIKRVTEPLRLELRNAIADPIRKVQDIGEQLEQLQEDKTPEGKAKRDELYKEIERITDMEMNPEWLKWGLVGISELDVDGVDITPENLREKGPQGLYAEILSTLKERTNLGGEEVKNLG